MDFTLTIYQDLLSTLQDRGYTYQTLAQFMTNPLEKVVILRHDVDRLPGNALKMARLEQEMGIMATYFFRAVPVTWDEDIIREIARMGHEVGYHFENLSMFKGDMDKAFADFKTNLERLRKLVPVSTVCMHGSPLSGIDNLDLLRNKNYKGLDLLAEPYLDVNYNQVFYITDTGRKWNNESSSVRDRVESGFDIEIKSTKHLIRLVEGKKEKNTVHEFTRMDTNEVRNISSVNNSENIFIASGESGGGLPDKIMLNVHPHRWFDFGVGWVKELVGQPIKNIAKTMMIKIHKKR